MLSQVVCQKAQNTNNGFKVSVLTYKWTKGRFWERVSSNDDVRDYFYSLFELNFDILLKMNLKKKKVKFIKSEK